MTKRKKLEPMNQFRYNLSTGHMNYVWGKQGKRYKSFGLTTSDKTLGRKNMPLEDNPEHGNTKTKSYIRNGVITTSRGMFARKASNKYSFSSRDFPKVKSKIRFYKKKR